MNILLPFEAKPNPVIADNPKLINFKYFFTRKLMFIKESDGFLLAPGGFGTLDETFELLTLIQTGKSDLHPIVMLDAPGGDYWLAFETFRPASLDDLVDHTVGRVLDLFDIDAGLVRRWGEDNPGVAARRRNPAARKPR